MSVRRRSEVTRWGSIRVSSALTDMDFRQKLASMPLS